MTFEWVQTDGYVVTNGSNDVNLSFNAPLGVVNTRLVFEFRATDGTNTAKDTVTVTVGEDADAQDANAGNDQSVVAGEVVTLDGSLTKAAGLDIEFQWEQMEQAQAVTLTPNETGDKVTFTAPAVSAETDLVFELQVSAKENNLKSIDRVTVHVTPAEGTDGGNAENNGNNSGPGENDQTTPPPSTPADTAPLSSILGQPLAIVMFGLLILLGILLWMILWV